MAECIFCEIVAGNTPATKVYEDDQVVAFADIHPVTNVHYVLVPKEHLSSLDTLGDQHRELVSHLLYTARKVGTEHDSGKHGYRIAINGGGQQDVDHLHLHVMGGQEHLGEPAEGGDRS